MTKECLALANRCFVSHFPIATTNTAAATITFAFIAMRISVANRDEKQIEAVAELWGLSESVGSPWRCRVVGSRPDPGLPSRTVGLPALTKRYWAVWTYATKSCMAGLPSTTWALGSTTKVYYSITLRNAAVAILIAITRDKPRRYARPPY